MSRILPYALLLALSAGWALLIAGAVSEVIELAFGRVDEALAQALRGARL